LGFALINAENEKRPVRTGRFLCDQLKFSLELLSLSDSSIS